MPKEDRRIIFTLEEIYEALSMRVKLTEQPPLPQDQVSNLEINADNTVVTVITDTQKKLQFEFSFFVISLVFFCNALNIPIPKAGKKTLSVSHDHVTMRIEL